MIFPVEKKKRVFGYSWSTLLWYRCYYPHRSRDAMSPVCGIFLLHAIFLSCYALASIAALQFPQRSKLQAPLIFTLSSSQHLQTCTTEIVKTTWWLLPAPPTILTSLAPILVLVVLELCSAAVAAAHPLVTFSCLLKFPPQPQLLTECMYFLTATSCNTRHVSAKIWYMPNWLKIG